MVSSKHITPISSDQFETKREILRKETIKKLSPGCTVRVVSRVMTDEGGRSHQLIRLSTWKEVSSYVIVLAKTWRPSPHVTREMARLRGPSLVVGNAAIVVAVLPEVQCEPQKTRPWVLLLTSHGQLGWCYAIDALELGY